MNAMADAADLAALLARKHALEQRAAATPAFAARLRALCVWQAERLANTHADLRRDPRYGAAAEFFLTDVYGSATAAQRDRELERAWRYLKRTLPRAAVGPLARALELDVLTADLDQAMAGQLSSAGLTAAAYAAAYRRVGRAGERRRQIDLLIGIGSDLDRIAHRAWLAMALRAAHAPAHAAGFGVLQDFLERGLEAFRHMRGAAEFLALIRTRELQLLETLMQEGPAAATRTLRAAAP